MAVGLLHSITLLSMKSHDSCWHRMRASVNHTSLLRTRLCWREVSYLHFTDGKQRHREVNWLAQSQHRRSISDARSLESLSSGLIIRPSIFILFPLKIPQHLWQLRHSCWQTAGGDRAGTWHFQQWFLNPISQQTIRFWPWNLRVFFKSSSLFWELWDKRAWVFALWGSISEILKQNNVASLLW